MSPGDAIAVAGIAAAAAFVGSLSGFGFALLLIPPLSLVTGSRDAVVLSALLGTFNNAVNIVRFQGDVSRGIAARVTLAAFAGMPLGLVALLAAPERVLRVLIGINVLLATFLVWRFAGRMRGTQWREAAAGFLSGALNTSTGINGPPLVLYFQATGMPAAAFRGTIAIIFAASNLLSIALFVATGAAGTRQLGFTAAGLPAVAAGSLCGLWVFNRLHPARFRSVVVGVLFASAVVVLVRAGLG